MWLTSWFLNFIPDSIFIWVSYTMFGVGVAFYIVSKLIKWIPMVSSYKFPMEILGVLLFTIGAFVFGSYGTEMVWRDRVKELEEKIKIAEAKSQQVNEVIKEKIIYKTKVIKQKEIEYIDRIKEVEKIIDGKCEVDPIAIEILNKAASDPTKEESSTGETK